MIEYKLPEFTRWLREQNAPNNISGIATLLKSNQINPNNKEKINELYNVIKPWLEKYRGESE